MVGNALCEHARRERNPAARARDRYLVRDNLGETRDEIGDSFKQHNTGRSVPGCWMFVSLSNAAALLFEDRTKCYCVRLCAFPNWD